MAFVMVYAMICYNISLNVGSLQNDFGNNRMRRILEVTETDDSIIKKSSLLQCEEAALFIFRL